jgi:hypothetical protein
MSQAEHPFIDARAYRPPGPWQARISNLLVLLTAGLLLLGGWVFKDWVEGQFRYFALAEDEVAVPYPPAWTLEFADEAALRVLEPDSAARFPPREEVYILPLEEDADLADLWLRERASQLREFVETTRRPVTLRDGRDALWISYAYVVEGPDGEAPLIAVRAVDLIFPARYGSQPRLIAVSLSAETDDWERVWPTFQRLLNWLTGDAD